MPTKIRLFDNEKSIFVGRQEYIQSKLRNALISSRVVSLIGPGDSGKTQLAYKAMHAYLNKNEELFDIVLPIYFAKGVPSFLDFLSDIAQKLGISLETFDGLKPEDKKNVIYDTLSNIDRPLLYLDNYEAVSDNKDLSKKDHVIDISFFINNEISQNTPSFFLAEYKTI